MARARTDYLLVLRKNGNLLKSKTDPDEADTVARLLHFIVA
jgi:hypothetical protein